MGKLFSLLISFYVSASLAGPSDLLISKVKKDPLYYSTSLTAEQKKTIMDTYLQTVEMAFKERRSTSKIYEGYRPQDLYKEYYKIAQALFIAGYSTENNFKAWSREYKELYSKDKLVYNAKTMSEDDFLSLWKARHKKVLESYFSNIESSGIGCAKEGDIVGNRKCCENHIRVSPVKIAGILQGQNCKISNTECNRNSDCCSGMCEKSAEGVVGKCLEKRICSRVREVGETCSKQNYICANSFCSEAENKEKISELRCRNCIASGGKLKAGAKCCPGLLKLEGKCVVPMPIFLPTVQFNLNKSKKKNILERVLDFFIASANAVEESSLSEAQQELLAQKTAECEKYGKNSDKYKSCLEQVETQKTFYTKDGYTGLTQDQMDSLTEAREKCTKESPVGSLEYKTCVEKVEKNEKLALATNMQKTQECLSLKEDSEKYNQCLVDKGALGVNLNKEEYLNKYSIPAITAKTYSDINKCEFNTYNDSWRVASNREKNAEIFLRGFEFVFSHKGSDDLWKDKRKQGIFTRANEIAVKFRENRSKMLLKMAETDRKMACKCIAIFGPSKFNSDKQEFFSTSCSAEMAQLRAQLGSEAVEAMKNTLNNESSEVKANGKVDGTSISSLNSSVSKNEKVQAAIEEIDKGAIGISHEAILVEWLHLRAEAQMERFVDNAALEEKLTELSRFISEDIDWYEVFKDDPKSLSRTKPSGLMGDTQLLYPWAYTISQNFLVAIIRAIFGSSWGKDKKSVLYEAADTPAMRAAWQYRASDEIHAQPVIYDAFTINKCIKKILGLCVKRLIGFHRWFVGPKYYPSDSNNATPTIANDEKCIVYARAASCFRSGYRVDFEGKLNYIVDVTRPLFTPPAKIATDQMHGYANDFRTILNKAHDDGIVYLNSRRPPGGKDGYGYYRTSRSFGNEDHLKTALGLGYFLPERGKLQEIQFESPEHNGKNAIINAAKVYALCKTLKNCGQEAENLNEQLTGFGYLFESPSEAAEFAEYVYEIHYKWSHLSKNDYMGYPLVGLDQYFAQTSFNMKLVGSYSSSRMIQYGDAANLYQMDFEKRVGEYSSLGTNQIGLKSRNIKISKAFYGAFSALNLDGKPNLEAFNAEKNNLISSGKLSKAQVSALNAAGSAALRRKKDLGRKEALDKALANASPETKMAYNRNKQFLESKVNNPLSQMSISKLGGMKKLASTLNSINDKIDGLNKANNKQRTGFNYKSDFSLPKRANFDFSSHASTGTNTASSTTDAANPALTEKQVDRMLRAAKSKNLASTEADTLFSRVSKAYRRNYARVLTKVSGAAAEGQLVPQKKQDLNDTKKSVLKELLK